MLVVFRKYSSIDNVYRTKTIRLIKEMGLEKEQFICTNKAHGANLSVINEAGKLTYAKRTGPIVNENFYSYECMVEREESKFRALFEEIGDGIIYGELIGGNYDHPDVKKYNEICVQKGIQYSPKEEFYAFDLFINGEYVNYDTATKLFLRHGLLYAKVLFRGTLDQCLEYPNEFEDPVPEWLGLPKIENNSCEGVVIKPVNAHYFGNGSRIILKNKNEKFTEKKQGQPKVTIDTSLTKEAQEKYILFSAYINENRLRNVLSKMGEVNQKDFGRIAGLFTQDVLEDGEKDGILLDGIGNQQKKFLKKCINRDCGDLLRENFVNIIDGEF